MIKRFLKAWRIAKLPDDTLETMQEVNEEIESSGDGEFLSDMTDEEYEDMIRKENTAAGKILKKLGL